MADYLGDFAATATVRVWWNTNAIAGESITRQTDGSIRIYKDGSNTQRSSSNGITDSEDVVTGVHRLSIDLSDNTDAGFYAAGSDYSVVLVAATVDGKTVNHAIGQFSIANRPVQGLAASIINAIAAAIDLAGIPAAVWDRLTSALTTPNSIGAFILSKLGLITAGSVLYNNPVEPVSGNLTLYNQDYTADSGIVRPEWTSDDWIPYGLLTAVSITLTWRARGTTTDTPIGTMTATANNAIRLSTLLKTTIQGLPYGKDAAGIKIVAVLDAAHGDDTVELVNAALNHYNYRKIPEMRQ